MFFVKWNLLVVLITCVKRFLLSHLSFIFFIIFQSFKSWQFLQPVPSTAKNGSKFCCGVTKQDQYLVWWHHNKTQNYFTPTTWNGVMPDACFGFACSNKVVPLRGVVLLKIPFWGDTSAECIKRRRRRVDCTLIKLFASGGESALAWLVWLGLLWSCCIFWESHILAEVMKRHDFHLECPSGAMLDSHFLSNNTTICLFSY